MTVTVVLLSGPSGAGKSRLAARLHRRHGWPVVRLDDFYRDGDDPDLPLSPLGIPDWDDPASWNADAALAALRELCDTGATSVPLYDISTSSATGSVRIDRDGAPVVVAEGIFAAHLGSPLAAENRLEGSFCVVQNRWLTAARRFVRDVGERRKPVPVLVRRGYALAKAEPQIVARARELGARPLPPRKVEELIDGR